MSLIYNIKEDNGNIWCLLLLKNGNLCSGSSDSKIKIYSLINFQCEKILLGHNSYITSLYELNNEKNKLLSSSGDSNIKLWDLISGNCVFSFKAHFSSVFKVIQISNYNIVSCSQDNYIKIWEYKENNFNLIKTLEKHIGTVYSIIEMKNFIISGSWDCNLLFWDINNDYNLFKIVPNVFNCSNNSLRKYDENRCMIGAEGLFYIVNIISFQIETKINTKIYEGFINSLCLIDDKNLIIHSGFNRNEIYIWDKYTFKKIKCIPISKATVFDIIYLGKNYIAISNDTISIIKI